MTPEKIKPPPTSKRGMPIAGARVLVLGLTFKENCPDLRNTRVVDIVAELRSFGVHVDVHDPWIDSVEAEHEYGHPPRYRSRAGHLRCDNHRRRPPPVPGSRIEGIRRFGRPGAVVYDVKYLFPADAVDGRL